MNLLGHNLPSSSHMLEEILKREFIALEVNEDLAEYLISIVRDLSEEDKHNAVTLSDSVGPFLVESSEDRKYSPEDILNLFERVLAEYGSSSDGGGSISSSSTSTSSSSNSGSVSLLKTPVCMKELSSVKVLKPREEDVSEILNRTIELAHEKGVTSSSDQFVHFMLSYFSKRCQMQFVY